MYLRALLPSLVKVAPISNVNASLSCQEKSSINNKQKVNPVVGVVDPSLTEDWRGGKSFEALRGSCRGGVKVVG